MLAFCHRFVSACLVDIGYALGDLHSMVRSLVVALRDHRFGQGIFVTGGDTDESQITIVTGCGHHSCDFLPAAFTTVRQSELCAFQCIAVLILLLQDQLGVVLVGEYRNVRLAIISHIGAVAVFRRSYTDLDIVDGGVIDHMILPAHMLFNGVGIGAHIVKGQVGEGDVAGTIIGCSVHFHTVGVSQNEGEGFQSFVGTLHDLLSLQFYSNRLTFFIGKVQSGDQHTAGSVTGFGTDNCLAAEAIGGYGHVCMQVVSAGGNLNGYIVHRAVIHNGRIIVGCVFVAYFGDGIVVIANLVVSDGVEYDTACHHIFGVDHGDVMLSQVQAVFLDITILVALHQLEGKRIIRCIRVIQGLHTFQRHTGIGLGIVDDLDGFRILDFHAVDIDGLVADGNITVYGRLVGGSVHGDVAVIPIIHLRQDVVVAGRDIGEGNNAVLIGDSFLCSNFRIAFTLSMGQGKLDTAQRLGLGFTILGVLRQFGEAELGIAGIDILVLKFHRRIRFCFTVIVGKGLHHEGIVRGSILRRGNHDLHFVDGFVIDHVRRILRYHSRSDLVNAVAVGTSLVKGQTAESHIAVFIVGNPLHQNAGFVIGDIAQLEGEFSVGQRFAFQSLSGLQQCHSRIAVGIVEGDRLCRLIGGTVPDGGLHHIFRAFLGDFRGHIVDSGVIDDIRLLALPFHHAVLVGTGRGIGNGFEIELAVSVALNFVDQHAIRCPDQLEDVAFAGRFAVKGLSTAKDHLAGSCELIGEMDTLRAGIVQNVTDAAAQTADTVVVHIDDNLVNGTIIVHGFFRARNFLHLIGIGADRVKSQLIEGELAAGIVFDRINHVTIAVQQLEGELLLSQCAAHQGLGAGDDCIGLTVDGVGIVEVEFRSTCFCAIDLNHSHELTIFRIVGNGDFHLIDRRVIGNTTQRALEFPDHIVVGTGAAVGDGCEAVGAVRVIMYALDGRCTLADSVAGIRGV